jgi:hypothetical protein
MLIAVGTSGVSQRLLASVLTLPVVSVSVLAVVSGNVFNAVIFAVLAGVLLGLAASLTPASRAVPSSAWVLAGASLIAFGWFYPHFLVTDTWTAYAYASPFGLLPCPTLSVVIGVTLAIGGFHSRAWDAVLATFGIVYGAIGVFSLGVSLDLGLLAGAILLGIRALDFSRHMRGNPVLPEPHMRLTAVRRHSSSAGIVRRNGRGLGTDVDTNPQPARSNSDAV